MPSRRLFIAADISDEARGLAAAHIDGLRRQATDVRVGWERPEKLHVTLKFLGNVAEEMIAAINDAAAAVARSSAPFEITIAGTGAFPNARQPRVLWLGVKDPGEALLHLAAALDDLLSAHGFEKEKRRYSPHLTIARVRVPQKAKRLAELHLQSRFSSQPFTIDELVVYESRLSPAGSTYHVISKHVLGTP